MSFDLRQQDRNGLLGILAYFYNELMGGFQHIPDYFLRYTHHNMIYIFYDMILHGRAVRCDVRKNPFI